MTPFNGNVLKSLRLKRGYTLEDVASAIGRSRQAVEQYEKGRNCPSLSTAIAIAELFGKPLDFFCNGASVKAGCLLNDTPKSD